LKRALEGRLLQQMKARISCYRFRQSPHFNEQGGNAARVMDTLLVG
jgi:hypothetical protein